MPHNIDATVNPATETMNRVFRPMRMESQPERGVMIAVAMR